MPRSGPRRDVADRILRAALDEAERSGWQALRLNQVAAKLGLALTEVYAHFHDSDAIAEAWLATADRAMLRTRSRAFALRPPPERLAETLLDWLGALSSHRKVTAEILLGKLYPGHPHYLTALVFRLSRTVQWWREAALLNAPPPVRQLEEIALTWLFVASVVVWANDGSTGQAATRRFVERRLAEAAQARNMLSGLAARARRA